MSVQVGSQTSQKRPVKFHPPKVRRAVPEPTYDVRPPSVSDPRPVSDPRVSDPRPLSIPTLTHSHSHPHSHPHTRSNGTPTHSRSASSGSSLPSTSTGSSGLSSISGSSLSSSFSSSFGSTSSASSSASSAASTSSGTSTSRPSSLAPIIVSSHLPPSSPTHRSAKPPSPTHRSGEKEELIASLTRGQIFEKYDLRSDDSVKKSTIFLQYKASSPDTRSHVLTWRTCALTSSSSGPQAVPTGPVQHLAVQSVVQLLLGKRTRAFMVGVGAEPQDSRCLSLCTDSSQLLNLEAPSDAIRARWCQGFHHILLMTGRKYSLNNYSPPKSAKVEEKKDVNDTIQQLTALMSQGNFFIKYDLDGSRGVKKSKVLVWRGPKKSGKDSPGSKADHGTSILYWCDAEQLQREAAGDRSRLQSSTNSMPLSTITDIYHGRQTPAFAHPSVTEQGSRCFSFAAGPTQTLNLVADSGRQRDLWVKGIHMLLKGAGKQMRKAAKLNEQLLLTQSSIRMMLTGAYFRQYKLIQLPQTDDSLESEPPWELRICEVFVFYKVLNEGQPGMFYWAESDQETSDGTPDCMALERIKDIHLGKRSAAFRHSGAERAPQSNCFSLISKNQILNLEAMSKTTRMHWLHGIQQLLEFYGNQPTKAADEKQRSPAEEKRPPIAPVRRRPSLPPSDIPPALPATAPPALGVGPLIHKPSAVGPHTDVPITTKSDTSGIKITLGLDEKDKKSVKSEDPQNLFTILAKIGEGAFGSVFKAKNKEDGELVAVKILKMDRKNMKSLRQEITVLGNCDSPYIVAYKGAYKQVSQSSVWICMEYCDSGSLSDMIEECRITLTEEQVAAVMKMALLGLDYIHNAKKIHRDLKAANILVTTLGDCKLADFGVSAEMKSTLAARKTAIGTPHWMAPEVINAHMKYNQKADIWSLGITAYELAVGEPPHSDVNQMRAIFLIPSCPPPTLPHPEKWSKNFKNFIGQCLQKNPDARPDAKKLLKDPFIAAAGGKEVIADLVRDCAHKRSMQKKENFKTLTMRLQTENGPTDADGKSDTVLRRPTELLGGEPNFSVTTKVLETAGDVQDEEFFQVVYS